MPAPTPDDLDAAEMARHEVRFTEHFEAPAARVFPLFAETARLAAAAGGPLGARLGVLRRIRRGHDPAQPDGAGAIRRIGFWPLAFDETIVTLRAPALIEYRVSRGSPMKHHRGRIAFAALADGSTRVDYRIRFEPRVPGTGRLIKIALRAALSPAFTRMRRQLAG